MNAVAPLRNITPFDEIVLEIEDLYAEARNWADGAAIETDEQDAALDVLDKALLKAGQDADDLRKAEVAPLDEAKAAIQKRFHPLIGDTKAGKGKVPLARETLAPIRSAYKAKKAAEKAAAAEKARREAEEERIKAEELLRASAGNLEARERAEEQLSLAKEADRFASRQEKRATTGLGMRTYYRAEVTDFVAAARHYWGPERPRFEALVLELAQRDATASAGKAVIPGIIFHEDKRAI